MNPIMQLIPFYFLWAFKEVHCIRICCELISLSPDIQYMHHVAKLHNETELVSDPSKGSPLV